MYTLREITAKYGKTLDEFRRHNMIYFFVFYTPTTQKNQLVDIYRMNRCGKRLWEFIGVRAKIEEDSDYDYVPSDDEEDEEEDEHAGKAVIKVDKGMAFCTSCGNVWNGYAQCTCREYGESCEYIYTCADCGKVLDYCDQWNTCQCEH